MPRDERYDIFFEPVRALMHDPSGLDSAAVRSVLRIDDCLAPSTIAAAVYGGHRAAREPDEPASDGVPFQRTFPALEPLE